MYVVCACVFVHVCVSEGSLPKRGSVWRTEVSSWSSEDSSRSRGNSTVIWSGSAKLVWAINCTCGPFFSHTKTQTNRKNTNCVFDDQSTHWKIARDFVIIFFKATQHLLLVLHSKILWMKILWSSCNKQLPIIIYLNEIVLHCDALTSQFTTIPLNNLSGMFRL